MHWIRIMGFLCAGFALAPAWAGNWTLLAEFDRSARPVNSVSIRLRSWLTRTWA